MLEINYSWKWSVLDEYKSDKWYIKYMWMLQVRTRIYQNFKLHVYKMTVITNIVRERQESQAQNDLNIYKLSVNMFIRYSVKLQSINSWLNSNHIKAIFTSKKAIVPFFHLSLQLSDYLLLYQAGKTHLTFKWQERS